MARSIELARLAYLLEAETKGLEADLKKAEGALGKTADFVKANPVAALGALAAAALAVGLQMAKMAGEVDTAVRKIGASLPEATGRMGDLKDVARELSVEFGVSQVAIVQSMEAIAKGGVDSVDDLIAATRAVQVAVKATGEETGTIVGLLDTTLDAFGLAAKDSEAVLAKLFVTAQGKTNLADLADILDRMAAPLAKAGIGFDTAASAAATLIGEGKSSKAVLAELTKTLNEGGTPAIEALAARSKDAGDGLKAMREQAALNNASLESLQAQLRENVNAAMIDLGTKILPVVLTGLQALIGLFDTLNGTIARIEGNAATATIQSIGGAIKSLSGEASTEALKRLESALGQVTQGIGTLSPGLRNVADKDLPGLRVGLQDALKSTDLSTTQMSRFTVALRLVDEQISKKGIKPLAESLVAVTGGAVSGTAAVDQLTAAERRAVTSSKELSEEQKKGLLHTKNLTDAQKELVEKAVKELGKRSTEAAKELKALRDEVEATFAAATSTLIDDTAEAIRRFEEKAKKVKLPAAEVKAFTDQLQAQGRALESIRLSAGLANEALKDPDPELALIQIGEALTVARDILNDLEPGTEAFNTQLDHTNDLLATQKTLQQRIKDEVTQQLDRERQLEALARGETVLLDGKIQRMDMVTGIISEEGVALDANKGKTDAHNTSFDKQIAKVAAVAQGVIGLATAFGIVDDEAAQVLANVVNIGANIGKALGGDPTAIISVLGSLAGVLGSLFGESPGEKIRREIVRANTQALIEVAREVGNLQQELGSGRDFAGIQEALESAFKQGTVRGGDFLVDGKKVSFNALLGRELAKRGLGIGDLEELAKTLNISLGGPDGAPNIAGLQGLLKALGNVEFGQFGQDFGGQRSFISTALSTGVRGRDEEFGLLAGLAQREKVSAITGALAGKDVTTAEGREAALAALRQLVEDLNTGSIDEKDFGGASGPQFLALLTDLIGILSDPDRAISGVGLPASEAAPDLAADFAASLDETFGAASPAVDYLAEIARNTAAFSPVAAPNLPASLLGPSTATGPGAITLQIGTIQISVAGGTDPAQTANEIADTLVDRLDRALYDRYRQSRATAGLT